MASKQIPDRDHLSLALAFAVAAGLFFFVVIIKLGNPVILDSAIAPPGTATEIYYESWPSMWGIWLLIPVVAMGLLATPWNRLKFRWIFALPAVWLAWEFVASTQSAGPDLTGLTMSHFTVCVGLFYLGYFALQGTRQTWPIWTGISLALCWVIHTGFQQHFGGLAAMRALVNSGQSPMSLTPNALNSPDFVKRLASNRIYSTFVYANALAGGLILILPLSLVFLWRLTPKVRLPSRVALVVIMGGAGLACLYWSGSKAGWLAALTIGLLALGHSAAPLKWKRALICGVLVAGVAAFAVKYASYFQKERNSTGARFAYWRAAMIVIKAHPWMGLTGWALSRFHTSNYNGLTTNRPSFATTIISNRRPTLEF